MRYVQNRIPELHRGPNEGEYWAKGLHDVSTLSYAVKKQYRNEWPKNTVQQYGTRHEVWRYAPHRDGKGKGGYIQTRELKRGSFLTTVLNIQHHHLPADGRVVEYVALSERGHVIYRSIDES